VLQSVQVDCLCCSMLATGRCGCLQEPPASEMTSKSHTLKIDIKQSGGSCIGLWVLAARQLFDFEVTGTGIPARVVQVG